ncbi:MAG: TRAP transporter small permease [Clostridia bacterium]|nr:TRAP transporter small permease [Clostridia bacterium]
MSEKKKFDWKHFIINLDQYISAVVFIAITFLLLLQVISRKVFNHAFTWAEELAVVMFIWMTFFGISSAVTYRKHLRIDAVIDALPFKAKKVLLIISDIIFIIFNCYLWVPYTKILDALGNSTTALLHIPNKINYILIPIMLTFASAKLVADIWKLAHENEKTLGATKPTIDLEACERECEERKKARREAGEED